MDPCGSRVLPALSSSARITEPLLRAGPALDQLHRLPSGDVDRGQQDKPIGPSCGI
jgi:hypothetical protein